MFYKYQSLTPDALPPDRLQRANSIAEGLPEAEILDVERRFVRLQLPNLDEVVEGDVTRTGFTVYLGGFDWVTFTTPQVLLQRFPEFMPLPQQVYATEEET